MEKNVELVQDIYAAIGRSDMPAVLGRMAEDIEIHLPGPSEIPFAGTYLGHDGVGHVLCGRQPVADYATVPAVGSSLAKSAMI
jgi:ketosteroid isomerase-like protein